GGPPSRRRPAGRTGVPRGRGPGGGGDGLDRAAGRPAAPGRAAHATQGRAARWRSATRAGAVAARAGSAGAGRGALDSRGVAKGLRVVAAKAERSRVIRGQSPQRFAQLAGHRLEEVERSGKWMLLRFDGSEGLLSHLGMTGKWIRRDRDAAPPSHVRATLELE